MLKIRTLTGVSNKDILHVFNESFSDYFIPFQLSEEQLALKMLVEKVNLNFSVGVFDDKRLVAFILHGFDQINNENIIYNAGTGVVPEKRGSGLTKQMYHFILPILRENGIDKLFLEVISENIQAIKSYEKSGYNIVRALACYKGDLSVSALNADVKIDSLPHYNWGLMQSFWDISPTWQNAINIVNELSSTNISLGAYIDSQLVGYVIYNPKNNRIQQIAVSKKFRQQHIGSTLLGRLIEKNGHKCSVINVDNSANGINRFFEKIGLEKNIKQLEMKLPL